MIALLGPPPLDFIQASAKSASFWDDAGRWVSDVPIPDRSLGSLEWRSEGNEKKLFLSFIRKMLQWRPEDRGGILDIFWDEWLLADLIESGEIKLPLKDNEDYLKYTLCQHIVLSFCLPHTVCILCPRRKEVKRREWRECVLLQWHISSRSIGRISKIKTVSAPSDDRLTASPPTTSMRGNN